MTAFDDSGGGTTVTMIFGRPDHDRPLPRILLALTVLVLGGSLRRRLTDRCNALFALIRAAEDASTEDRPEPRSSR
jgi:hypothetical protein